MGTNEPREALANYKGELDRLRTAMDLAFGLNQTNNAATPEDMVVFPLGVATRDLFEEIHLLVYHDRGDAALRASRTLYECVVFAAYISKHPDTYEAFLNTLFASWANILRSIPEPEKLLPKCIKIYPLDIRNTPKANKYL